MQTINKEKVSLENTVNGWNSLFQKIEDFEVLVEMSEDESDESSFQEVVDDLDSIESKVSELETQSLLSGELDPNSCYMSINSGAGGTEACDWAQMLLRMYTRYADLKGFKTEILSVTDGDEAGIKSVTIHIDGPYAYGLLKAETGVHRLVRISPFDANAKRHTSFTSIATWPEVSEDVNVEIDMEEIRVDTYRAGGKGGQHVNRTDSAVRMTHVPTNIVVQCQSERSQIQNREKCLKMLRAALYEKEVQKLEDERAAVMGEKKANEWGSQIRSYVLAPYQMVKDHRTNTQTSATDKVLDGDMDLFIESYLKEKNKQEVAG